MNLTLINMYLIDTKNIINMIQNFAKKNKNIKLTK